MKYQNNFENFIDGIDFKKEDPCVWIVYPPGAAGDLLAAIINFHYARTGCHYFGITDFGQTIFRPSDGKLINIKYIDQKHQLNLSQQFIHDVNTELGKKNLNYSLMDQVIFSNHACQKQQVGEILNFFPNSKIIRILPKNTVEQQIILWLETYKNFQQIPLLNFSKTTTLLPYRFTHPRLLNVNFGDLFSQQTFEQLYNAIIKHLDLEYKLIRFDFIEYWIDQQHELIKPVLKTINNY